MSGRIAFLLAGLFVVQCLSAGPLHGAAATDDRQAMLLGHRVAAVRAAIQNPDLPGAMQAVTDLGHDQRYYVMVRGWLAYQLQGDLSIVDAGQPSTAASSRIRFLRQAIRAIDLE